ncbi:hypothetical protein QQY66_49105 [Streptomyces sp. DG2A-72]|uniref:hypothetical protein n=1 Tax=Streptomyces sp. DG2A-72 TaxID=3051386 RepID=UPI00265C54E8|nr:hypothetical protein [Streptomyces sp. DG2A-72]MDO0939273.1 hypothetical protein [Streptomyces sp. DG2A-72]
MSTTMPETSVVRRIAASARGLDAEARLDLSAVIGLDVDLVLGYEYEIPEGLSDEDHRAALFAAFTDEMTRTGALVDMIEAGYIDLPRSYGRLLVLADELTQADDADGFEADTDEELVGGWAA